MAHELDFSTGNAAIAVMEGTKTPWHGYANWLSADMIAQALEHGDFAAVLNAAGLNYNVRKTPAITYPAMMDDGTVKNMAYDNKAVVYRDDTGEALSVMSERSYTPAQPKDLVAGLFEVIKGTGFEIDTLGALRGGKVIWANAKRVDAAGTIGNDIQLPYLSLLTSYDGTFARQGNMTAIRRVCMNTVKFSLEHSETKTVKQRNSSEFTLEKANDLFDKLGEFDAAFAAYMDHARAMAKVKFDDKRLERFFTKLYAPEAFNDEKRWKQSQYDLDTVSTNKQNVIADLLNFSRDNPGANLPSADGTLWGAFNTVTYYQDWQARSKEGDNGLSKRWESAMIGNGAKVKSDAFDLALQLI